MATLRLATSNVPAFYDPARERESDVIFCAAKGDESQRILFGNTSNAAPVLTLEGATATVSGCLNSVETRSPYVYSSIINIGMEDPRVTEFQSTKQQLSDDYLQLLEALRARIAALEAGSGGGGGSGGDFGTALNPVADLAMLESLLDGASVDAWSTLASVGTVAPTYDATGGYVNFSTPESRMLAWLASAAPVTTLTLSASVKFGEFMTDHFPVFATVQLGQFAWLTMHVNSFGRFYAYVESYATADPGWTGADTIEVNTPDDGTIVVGTDYDFVATATLQDGILTLSGSVNGVPLTSSQTQPGSALVARLGSGFTPRRVALNDGYVPSDYRYGYNNLSVKSFSVV